MSDITLQGEGGHAGVRDAILLRDGEQPTAPDRRARYELALIELAMRNVICPHRALRVRLGQAYQQAWEDGMRPNLRFQTLRPFPLTPAPDPARERRLNPPLRRGPRLRALRAAAVAGGALLLLAAGRWLNGTPA